MSKFAERLKELRVERGLSKKQLAKELGIFTPAAVGLWESEKRTPNFDVVIAVAKYFAVTTDYLGGLED